MEKNYVNTRLYRFTEWIMNFAYINLLWILFTVVGLGVFGFAPATIAMFAVIRKLIMKSDTPIFKTFFHTFKKEFLKGNAVGLIIVVIGYILYVDFIYLGIVTGPIQTFLTIALFLIGIIYVFMLLMIFPVFVHYEMKFTHYFKHAIMLAIVNLHIIIFMAAGLVALYYLFQFIPGLTLFFFGSLNAAWMMWCALLAFTRIELKKSELEVDQEN